MQLLIRHYGPEDRSVSALCLYEAGSERSVALPDGCGRSLFCFPIARSAWLQMATAAQDKLSGKAANAAYQFGAFSFVLVSKNARREAILSPADSAALLRELADLTADGDLRQKLLQRAGMGAP